MYSPGSGASLHPLHTLHPSCADGSKYTPWAYYSLWPYYPRWARLSSGPSVPYCSLFSNWTHKTSGPRNPNWSTQALYSDWANIAFTSHPTTWANRARHTSRTIFAL